MNRTLIAVALTAALGGCGGSSSDDGDAVAAADPNVDPVPGGTSTADPFEPLDPDAPAPPDGGGSTTPPGDDPGTASGDDSGAASGDGTGTPSGDGSAPDVNADNHVALLGYVFDVFNGSADGYGHDILSLPGYSDPRVAAPPSGSENDVFETERASCGNGGTAEFTPYIFGYREVTYGWTFAFDGCQDDARVLDGDLFRSDSSLATARSEGGFSVDEQTRRLDFSGEVRWAFSGSRAYDSREWNLDGVDYTVTEGERTVFELRDANASLFTVRPFENVMSGGFRVRSDATGGRSLGVRVLENLRYDYTTYEPERFDPPRFSDGVLEIAGEDGSTLTLDAGTGDLDTVEITLRAGDAVETFTQPWSIWEDGIQCSYASGYGTEPVRGCLDPEG